ncbi:alpha/beta fold hydrolase [Ruania halotolerans]|uniref:alpha/beta fold hydrolase n=1 Tax=Ruania halotolerans TaxID=2897773 RepID=UPI001E5BEF27|nr:alpha/beta hydrolase [Ruania halotolerans]UFU08256.1 alpha/beta hydrolase [Ruania halotolerans]
MSANREHRTVLTPDGVALRVVAAGAGREALMLSGGPGCVNYLADPALVPDGVRGWCPDPRGVGASGGEAHDMTQAVADLETIRTTLGLTAWDVVGHSWGSDLAIRYALDHPESVRRVVGIAGHGFHKDRTWSALYEARKHDQPSPEIPYDVDVWRSLNTSFTEWIHEPDLWRRLADSTVPMTIMAAGDDIRPPWPLHQIAALVPRATLVTLPDVPHDFWHTHPDIWRDAVGQALVAGDDAGATRT